MNHTSSPTRIPDTFSLASEAALSDTWESGVLAEIIRRKSAAGEAPTSLLLGRREAALLRSHWAAAFGEDSVVTLKGSYYMGLEVVEIDCPEFFHTCGHKTTPRPCSLQHSPPGRLSFSGAPQARPNLRFNKHPD